MKWDLHVHVPLSHITHHQLEKPAPMFLEHIQRTVDMQVFRWDPSVLCLWNTQVTRLCIITSFYIAILGFGFAADSVLR